MRTMSSRLSKIDKSRLVGKGFLLGAFVDKGLNREGANDNFFYVHEVPVSKAKEMLGRPYGVNPTETQNNSPIMKDMIGLAEHHNGTLFGYVIPKESGRQDARITFDGVMLKIDDSTAQKLRDKFHPDEFSREDDGRYRFWWD